MKRHIPCLALALALGGQAPATLAADVEIDVRLPGVRIQIGDRDRKGHYWDGKDWRAPRWWHSNCARLREDGRFRGRCDAPLKRRHCPPGQAKKGRC